MSKYGRQATGADGPAYQGKPRPKNYRPLPKRVAEYLGPPDAPDVRARAISRWERMKATEFADADGVLPDEAELDEQARARLAEAGAFAGTIPLSAALRRKLGVRDPSAPGDTTAEPR
jgi:hypothetical protein